MWNAYLLLFLTSACIMTVELVAGRLVAPHIGVSLYTWTGIIGACLTGMSFGSLFGGWLADRARPDRWVPGMIYGAAAFILGLSLLHPVLGEAARALGAAGVPPLFGIFALSMTLFGIPCFFLAAVSPLVYKLALKDPDRVGTTLGRLGASGIAGSITGTYATGFWLIPTFGTRAILGGIAMTLGLLGSVYLTASPMRRTVTAVLAITVALLTSSAVPVAATRFCEVESAYYCIRVVTLDRGEGVGPVKQLRLDYLTHSGVRLQDPEELWYDYEKVVSWIMRAKDLSRARTLFLGGGGYILPHWVEKEYPKAAVEVVEIDPAVTKVALSQFVPESRRIRTLTADARLALQRLPADGRYDVIFGDVFNDLSVPYHLTTVEFARLVRERLANDGLYILNVIDQTGSGPLLNAMTATLRQAFAHVYVLPGTKPKVGRGPHIIVASAGEVDWAAWERHPWKPHFPVGRLSLPTDGLVLTDDYAPTDQLLLPLFADRWAP